MAQIDVVARVDGFHPGTGLSLVQGETYTIDAEQFGEEVFEAVSEEERSEEAPAETIEGGKE